MNVEFQFELFQHVIIRNSEIEAVVRGLFLDDGQKKRVWLRYTDKVGAVQEGWFDEADLSDITKPAADEG